MALTASGNPTYELRHARCTDVQTWHDNVEYNFKIIVHDDHMCVLYRMVVGYPKVPVVPPCKDSNRLWSCSRAMILIGYGAMAGF
jgi:hypothetical protein